MSSLNGILKWFYDLGNWLARMMYIHILWAIFTVLGLGVFGIMPSTAALFSVMHKWFDDGFDTPIFKRFYTTYKKQFLKSNALGVILLGFGIFLYVDMNISKEIIQSPYVHIILLLFSLLFFVTTLYFFPVFARYELKYLYYFKQSFFIALARPFETIAMLLCLLILYYFFSFLPVMLFFAGSTLIAFPIAWFAHRAFVQIEEKKINQ